MLLKRFISLFLLLTLMLQMLPIKQVGAILFNNQINEEIPHMYAFKDCFKKQPLLNDYLIASYFHTASKYLTNSNRFISYSSEIPCNYSFEILVPPPNIV